MSRKIRFKPKITRVKLNPEQAVLGCSCWDNDHRASFGSFAFHVFGGGLACSGRGGGHIETCQGGSGHGFVSFQSVGAGAYT